MSPGLDLLLMIELGNVVDVLLDSLLHRLSLSLVKLVTYSTFIVGARELAFDVVDCIGGSAYSIAAIRTFEPEMSHDFVMSRAVATVVLGHFIN